MADRDSKRRHREGDPDREPLDDARGGDGDAILGAALEGLRRAADEVEVERSTAETLQRSLLREQLPEVAGVRMAARYVAGSSEARIGGDWYDAIPLRDGRLALVIGDVVGRGVAAAARMAHLQSAVRAYALEGLRPALVLERMNGFVLALERRCTATMLFAVVDPGDETVRFASAGHPPPLLIDPEGAPQFGQGPSGNPLGAQPFPHYEETTLALTAGSALVLYTDGLVEGSERPLEEGMADLRRAGVDFPDEPEEGCRAVLDRVMVRTEADDDVALMVVRLDVPAPSLDLIVPAEPASLMGVRRALGRWLQSIGTDPANAYELQVACGEACANAIAHAYPPGDATFLVRADRDGDELTIEVKDSGEWRLPRGGTGGRGLALIEQLTDSLEIERGTAGTTVRMRRRSNGAKL